MWYHYIAHFNESISYYSSHFGIDRLIPSRFYFRKDDDNLKREKKLRSLIDRWSQYIHQHLQRILSAWSKIWPGSQVISTAKAIDHLQKQSRSQQLEWTKVHKIYHYVCKRFFSLSGIIGRWKFKYSHSHCIQLSFVFAVYFRCSFR